MSLPWCGCWAYLGAWNSGNGYSKLSWEGQTWMAHRLTFHLLVAPVCRVVQLDHRCRWRPCCNPGHLTPHLPVLNTLLGDAVLFRAAGLPRVAAAPRS